MIDYGQDHDDSGSWIDEDGTVHDSKPQLRVVADNETQQSREVWPGPDAPLDVADRLAHESAVDGVPTIGRLRGTWWRWSGSSWAEVHDESVRGLVYARMRDAAYWLPPARRDEEPKLVAWNPTARKVSDVLDAMASSSAALPHGLEPGHLVDGTPAAGLIPMRTGVLNLATRTVQPHHPRLFSTSALPYDIDPGAGAEPQAWLEFLDGLFADDPDGEDKIGLLREWFGYLLSGRTDQQKALLLVGPTRSGKGTILSVAEALVGTENTAATSFSALAGNFGLGGLTGKTLAVVGDSRERPAPAALERILSIVGNDAVMIDRKFRDPVTTRLGVRFMIASNEVPDLGDRSAAAVGRFLIFRMTRSFYGREDLGLGTRLLAELPEIANWALAGLDRLAERGRFAEPASARAEREELSREASPVRMFLDDALVTGPDHVTPAPLIYELWAEWCGRHGFKSGSTNNLGRQLREAVPDLARTRLRTEGRPRAYRGVAPRRSYTGDGAAFGQVQDADLRRRAAEYAVDDE